jgi:hypothetical protein
MPSRPQQLAQLRQFAGGSHVSVVSVVFQMGVVEKADRVEQCAA